MTDLTNDNSSQTSRSTGAVMSVFMAPDSSLIHLHLFTCSSCHPHFHHNKSYLMHIRGSLLQFTFRLLIVLFIDHEMRFNFLL